MPAPCSTLDFPAPLQAVRKPAAKCGSRSPEICRQAPLPAPGIRYLLLSDVQLLSSRSVLVQSVRVLRNAFSGLSGNPALDFVRGAEVTEVARIDIFDGEHDQDVGGAELAIDDRAIANEGSKA